VTWNPQQYDKFSQPRLRPALDLIAAIPTIDPKNVVDLGCGTGSITRLLAERWPRASVTGIDDSAAMLAKTSDEPANIRWINQSVADWGTPDSADLIFSNAALQWLPDHSTLFKRLAGVLKPGGVLAVQMPRNFSAPSHTLIAETARSGPWRSKLEPLLGPDPVAEPHFYYTVLAPLGRTLDLWETQYFHLLEGPDPVKEWTKGTWLRRFLDRLDPDEAADFERHYADRLRDAYPPSADCKTWFPFRRLFIVVRK
jgi:trans-aconitate 2-methyltransferase